MSGDNEIPRPLWALITAVSLAVSCLWIAIRMPSGIDSFRVPVSRETGTDPIRN
jgi:hypothetical protein